MPRPSSPLIVVLGPTGSGKSELALVLAETLGGEIINCDSIQVYQRLDIGSAKLSPAERRAIPHHLIDVIDVEEEITAGAYARMARLAVSGVHDRGHVPIVAGGTGLYLRALLDGLSPAPVRDGELRERLGQLAARRPGALHRYLRFYDRQAARRIHPNDLQKLIRAVEITSLAQQPVTATQSQPREAFSGIVPLKLGLAPDRALLYKRLNGRCRSLFEQGLLNEAKSLLDAGFSPNLRPLQSLGYKQAFQHLTGGLPYEDAIEECQAKTRQFAKRQMTWFRKEQNVHWLQGFGADTAIRREALDLCRNFLALA